MALEENVGQITVSGNFVFWKIENFLNLPQEVNTLICSKNFHYENREWTLYLLPQGHELCASEGWLGMAIADHDDCLTSESFSIRLGFIKECQKEIMRVAIRDGGKQYSASKIIRRSVFDSDSQMTHNGTLHAFGLIRKIGCDSTEVSPQLEMTQDIYTIFSGLKEIVMTCYNIFKNIKEEASIGENSLELHVNGMFRLYNDVKELLHSGQNSDLTIKVDGTEFKVHRLIMKTRSPVFSAMLEHDMKEKSTGMINIQDVTPDTFSNFLNFLYTGTIDNLTFEKSLTLYVTADRYQVDELKNICVKCMLQCMSVENFCEIMSMSLQYNEKELIDEATHFFVQNSKDIALTTKWQTFLSENPTAGNELFLKALDAQRQ